MFTFLVAFLQTSDRVHTTFKLEKLFLPSQAFFMYLTSIIDEIIYECMIQRTRCRDFEGHSDPVVCLVLQTLKKKDLLKQQCAQREESGSVLLLERIIGRIDLKSFVSLAAD